MMHKSIASAVTLCTIAGSPLAAHEISEMRAAIEGVWVSADAPVARPDISNINDAGRRIMAAYDQSEDGVLNCLLDWGRLNTVASFPMEVITGERQVTILYEYNHAVRRVFLDQNDVPVDYPPSLVGYSIGRWEGVELVVETRNLLAGWINMEGVAPYTEDAVMRERFVFDDEAELLVVERTMNDPRYYDGPVTWTTRYRISEYPIYPYDCTVGSYLTSDD